MLLIVVLVIVYMSSSQSFVNKPSYADMIRNNPKSLNAECPSKKLKTDEIMKKGTIYITVGPQCSGKTTMLKHVFGEDPGGVDITIDDQQMVYISVPTNYFLHDPSDSPDATSEDKLSLHTEVLGKTIRERINDSSNDELRNVIRRMGEKLSAEEFDSLIRGNGEQHDDLISAVEDTIRANHVCLPENVDLFVVESIFRPRPLHLMGDNTCEVFNNSSSALDAALDLLKSYANNSHFHPTMTPIAWGNTNTRPREYASALEAARLSQRPVEFIAFGGMDACDMIHKNTTKREYRRAHESSEVQPNCTEQPCQGQSKVLSLPKLSRPELFKRNLHRFINSGRYIPSNAINDAMVRVESLLASAISEEAKNGSTSTRTVHDAKFRLDYQLAKLADYELNNDRTVRRVAPNHNANRGYGETLTNYHSAQSVRGRVGRGGYYNDTFQGRSYDDRRHTGRHRPYNSNHRSEHDMRSRNGRGQNSDNFQGRYQYGERHTGGRHPNGGRWNDSGGRYQAGRGYN